MKMREKSMNIGKITVSQLIVKVNVPFEKILDINIVQKETALVKTGNKKSKDQRTFAFIMLYNYLSALAAACTRALRRDFLRAAVFL